MTRCTISHNQAAAGGGVAGGWTITDSFITDNTAGGEGGGFFGGGGSTVEGPVISGNQAGHGGGNSNFFGMELRNSTVSGNRADDFAGGIYNDVMTNFPPGVVELSTGSHVSGNNAGAPPRQDPAPTRPAQGREERSLHPHRPALPQPQAQREEG